MSGVKNNTALSNPMRRIRHVHFIGIGGVGMSGIAEVLLNLGYQVSGSDLKESATTKRLQEQGATLFVGHHADNIQASDAVVISSAVDDQNPEVVAAKTARIPLVPRAQMLAELMRFRQGIAVAGTHGKTTTTSLTAALLAAGGLDPTYVIGGRVNNAVGHGRLGQGDYLVAEADESDASFLFLQPVVTIVTNIDADHLSTYGGDFARLQNTFSEFIHHLPFYGLAVLCIDDPVVAEMLPSISRPVLSYGFSSRADVKGSELVVEQGRSQFRVSLPESSSATANAFDVTLALPGRHNAENALAAIAVAHELGVSANAIQATLAQFPGVGRRFQRYGAISAQVSTDESVIIELIDDYGHHPTELQATIAAARESWPSRRLVVAFQPHRYSRTRDLFDDFAAVLSQADVLVLTEVYPAGESVITGADGRALSKAIRARGKVDPIFIGDVMQLDMSLRSILQEDDVLLTMGAGNIGAVAAALPEQLSRPRQEQR